MAGWYPCSSNALNLGPHLPQNVSHPHTIHPAWAHSVHVGSLWPAISSLLHGALVVSQLQSTVSRRITTQMYKTIELSLTVCAQGVNKKLLYLHRNQSHYNRNLNAIDYEFFSYCSWLRHLCEVNFVVSTTSMEKICDIYNLWWFGKWH